MDALLVIDDDAEHAAKLCAKIREALSAKGATHVEVLDWSPNSGDDPLNRFKAFLEAYEVRLVITDYDLTSQGTLGLFGATIVDWCQLHALPVGDFSRKNFEALAAEPNLFELRIPIGSPHAAEHTAELYLGFDAVRTAVEEKPDLLKQRNPGAALAPLLGRPSLTTQFAQYGARYGSANASLADIFTKSVPAKERDTQRTRVFAYIVGHILVNSVLRFPGPILSSRALAAYLAIAESQVAIVAEVLQAARYNGPFGGLDDFWWTEGVDTLLDDQRLKLREGVLYATAGAERRALIELAVGGILEKDPQCPRCAGQEGGLYCPYTKQTVCERSDCSVGSSAWIPQGARLCRLERDFYEEWAPILGM